MKAMYLLLIVPFTFVVFSLRSKNKDIDLEKSIEFSEARINAILKNTKYLTNQCSIINSSISGKYESFPILEKNKNRIDTIDFFIHIPNDTMGFSLRIQSEYFHLLDSLTKKNK